ncbi:hypothetical protein BHM03_00043376 [Ensete ventricosum]|nr:hypothetical protein BHM03_00043376 [Ensete ventricosum]
MRVRTETMAEERGQRIVGSCRVSPQGGDGLERHQNQQEFSPVLHVPASDHETRQENERRVYMLWGWYI